VKQRLKCLILSVVIVLGISLPVGLLYGRNYSLEADNSNLPEAVCAFMNRGQQRVEEDDFQFHGTADIGTKRFVLMEFESEQLGLIRLHRGWNGRYRIDSVSCGGGNFRNEVVEEAGSWYLLFGGRNAYFGIHSVEFRVGGETYSMETPQRDRFLIAVKLGREPELKHLLPVDQICFYDADGRDITEEVPWN